MLLHKIKERKMSAGSELCASQLAVGASNFRPREEADFCDEDGHMLYQGPTEQKSKMYRKLARCHSFFFFF